MIVSSVQILLINRVNVVAKLGDELRRPGTEVLIELKFHAAL